MPQDLRRSREGDARVVGDRHPGHRRGVWRSCAQPRLVEVEGATRPSGQLEPPNGLSSAAVEHTGVAFLTYLQDELGTLAGERGGGDHVDVVGLPHRERIATAKGIDDGSLKLLGGQDGVVELVDVWTRSGTVAKFSVFRETVEGTKATVWAYIAYEDGTIIPEDKTVLILRDGVWKVRLF